MGKYDEEREKLVPKVIFYFKGIKAELSFFGRNKGLGSSGNNGSDVLSLTQDLAGG